MRRIISGSVTNSGFGGAAPPKRLGIPRFASNCSVDEKRENQPIRAIPNERSGVPR